MPSLLFQDLSPVFWLICLCGLASLLIFIERFLQIKRARINYKDFLNGALNNLSKNSEREVIAICEETPGPVSRLLATAIDNKNEQPEALRQILNATGKAEIERMERRLAFLATITQIAPLLGLLGTILGIFRTVLLLRTEIPLVQTVNLTDGLITGLSCTIAGLLVTIPSYAFYNTLVVLIDRVVLDMEQATAEILAFITRSYGTKITSEE